MSQKTRKLLSQRHPILYQFSVGLRRLQRRFVWMTDDKKYSHNFQKEPLPFRIKKHQSVLIRKLGDSDMYLQQNKTTNLKLAVSKINTLLIHPGETFSFCKTVGKPTAKKGYLQGMELSFGVARPGIGGGICQISNLIHWLVLHSPLTITERYHHSFDPFPDDGRVLPFGSGATVFYNYRDYQFTNNTKYTFQLNLWFSEKCLEGDLRINEQLDFAYHVFEKNHQFIKQGDVYFRKNEIWREKYLKFEGGKILETEKLIENFARVTYTPEEFENHSK